MPASKSVSASADAVSDANADGDADVDAGLLLLVYLRVAQANLRKQKIDYITAILPRNN